MILYAVIVAIVALTVAVYFWLIRSREKKKYALDIELLQNKIADIERNHEKEIVREAIALFEREMQQMGADLHDDLVQKLAGFRLFMDRIERASGRSETEAILVKMNGEFIHVIDSVRRISRRLLPEGIEAGSLNGALNELCNRIGPGRMAHIHFQVQGTEHALSQDQQLQMFRIVQELINNIIKHTVAWHIWVRVNWLFEKRTIEVEDDGLHHEQLVHAINHQNKGFLTLQKRAMLINANVSYKPAEKGTKALVELIY